MLSHEKERQMARQSYSKEFKARVALDALKGQKTVSERDRLYQKVGQLQVEVDWLKKSQGR